jgi:transcription-repair coupling factor (superfamily II helicase)
VIVDEEQRFGVEHKEHLKRLRTAVDVLAMSATPIPRTLEMAVTGIREMSVIQTPPEERHPVLTFVGAYDERQIAAAVRRELLREGQVFYVHNRVGVDRPRGGPAARARAGGPDRDRARPDERGHAGAGDRRLLGEVVRRAGVHDDRRVGLDIANANTLVVERADVFGLSQLHQLRGRVGRGGSGRTPTSCTRRRSR